MPSEYITCIDCKTEFEHPERDQEFFAERGFSSPKRCKTCRIKKKAKFDRSDGGFRRDRRDSDEFGRGY